MFSLRHPCQWFSLGGESPCKASAGNDRQQLGLGSTCGWKAGDKHLLGLGDQCLVESSISLCVVCNWGASVH